LIDVVFLMLIFFMVSTTFDKQTQLKVDLPEASAQAESKDKPDQIEIKIDKSGHFLVNDQALIQQNADTLQRTLQKIADGRQDLPVTVYGDKDAPYKAMMTVMDVAGQLGISHLSFVAKQSTADQAD
jgi:biopolymer transport protein ExbD